MPTYQYQVYSHSQWMAQSGNALVALVNRVGSGKKLLVRSVEVYNWNAYGPFPAADSNLPMSSALTLARATGVATRGGEALTPMPLDTAAAAWPATVDVRMGGSGTPTLPAVFISPLCKNYSGTAHLTSAVVHGSVGPRRSAPGSLFSWSRQAACTPLVLAAGEAAMLYAAAPGPSLPLFIEAEFRIGTRTYVTTGYWVAGTDAAAALTINNAVGSGQTVELLQIAVSEVGSYDTPYLQLVPIASVDPRSVADLSKRVAVVKTDTSHPDLDPATAVVLTNAPVAPFGVPESALAEGSPGSPRGFNYLQAKDFIGPQFMAVFPEPAHFKRGANHTSLVPGTLGFGLSRRLSRIKGCGDGAEIVLREGEGLALVSGAETATGTNAVGLSGWVNLEFGITFQVAPATTPSVTLTGLQIGSDVVILVAGTSTVRAEIDASPSSTFSWGYEYAPGESVDIVVHKAGFQYLRYSGLALTLAGLSLPVTQTADRNYANA